MLLAGVDAKKSIWFYVFKSSFPKHFLAQGTYEMGIGKKSLLESY